MTPQGNKLNMDYTCFNPLHYGEGFLTYGLTSIGHENNMFQSPALRGGFPDTFCI